MRLRKLAVLMMVGKCLLCFGSSAQAQAQANVNGVIVDRTAYAFPPYEQAVKTTDVEKYTDQASSIQ